MKRALELWTNLTAADRGDPSALIARARMLETDGWDGATYPDSHSLLVETFVTLTACAQATARLRLSPGVTNPATRHPAVIAAAMMTLNRLSAGRMVLGIGRGDSSLAYIGGSPVSVAAFDAALDMLDGYMRGKAVPIELAATALARNSREGFGDDLAMHHAPEGSLLKWVTQEHIRPPVDVFCTGPKVIELAARKADYITFALGADVRRLEWAMGIARTELQRIGRDPATISFGAHIPCFPHHDPAIARALGEGYITAQARFGVMTNKVNGPADEHLRANLERLAGNYDMRSHGSGGSTQASMLDQAFIQSFGLMDSAGNSVARLKEIVALGIDRLQLVTSDTDSPEGIESYRITAKEIVPALREIDAG